MLLHHPQTTLMKILFQMPIAVLQNMKRSMQLLATELTYNYVSTDHTHLLCNYLYIQL